MPAYKIRRTTLAQGGLQVGSSGTVIPAIFAGMVSACFLSMANGASAAASAVITGASPGDIVFLTTACTTGSAFISSASITAANSVSFKTYNSSSGTSAASTILLQYLVVRPA